MTTALASIPAARNSHAAAAAAIVKDHAGLAMLSSLVPVPFFEFAAVSVVHLNMIEDLTREYRVDFGRERAQAIIAAVLSGYASRFLGSFLAGSLAKLVPGLGSAIALVTLPSVAASLTYALGYVFIQHFEQGGSLFDIDCGRARVGFWQNVEQNRVNPAELARVIGSRKAEAGPVSPAVVQ